MDLKEKVLTILGAADGPMQPDLLGLLVARDKQSDLNAVVDQLALEGRISVANEGIMLLSENGGSDGVNLGETRLPSCEANIGEISENDIEPEEAIKSEEAVDAVEQTDDLKVEEETCPERPWPELADDVPADDMPKWPWPELADDVPADDMPKWPWPELADDVPTDDSFERPWPEYAEFDDAKSAVVEPAKKPSAESDPLLSWSLVDALPCKKNSITKAKLAGVATIGELISRFDDLDVSDHVRSVLIAAVGQGASDAPCLKNAEQIATLQTLSGSKEYLFDPLGFVVKAPELASEFTTSEDAASREKPTDARLVDILSHEPTLKRLVGSGISTVSQFEAKSQDELLEIRGFGLKKYQIALDAIKSWRDSYGVARVEIGPMSLQEFCSRYDEESIAAVADAYESIDPEGKFVNRDSFVVFMLPFAAAGAAGVVNAFWNEIATEERLVYLLEVFAQNATTKDVLLSGQLLIPAASQWAAAARVVAAKYGWDFNEETGSFAVRGCGFEEWIGSLDDRTASILKARFSNKTLDEVGKQFGMTKERIRQIVNRELGRRPKLIEDRYAYFVETYSMSEEEFCGITGMSSIVFGYLMEVASTRKADRKPLADALSDETLGQALQKAITSADLKGFVLIDGFQVPLKRYDITMKLVKQGTQNGPMSFDALLSAF
mgnify:FL=1